MYTGGDIKRNGILKIDINEMNHGNVKCNGRGLKTGPPKEIPPGS